MFRFTTSLRAWAAWGLVGICAVAQGQQRTLNDTGADRCKVSGKITRDCKDSGQDAGLGRDVTTPSHADGRLGFSFQKVAADGRFLPASAAQWACTLDRVTGLMWEMKTSDGSLHDGKMAYVHEASPWMGGTAYQDLLDASNQEALCGHTDWRLPEQLELQSIADYSRASPQPAVDERFFPNTSTGLYWTSQISVADSASAAVVSARDGAVATYGRWNPLGVRLVRGAVLSPTSGARFIAREGQVLDTFTQLVWRRCAEPQVWQEGACVGAIQRVKWGEALKVAQRAASQSGQAWRLPNVKELQTLVDSGKRNPAIDTSAFTGFWPGTFWTSTLKAGEPNYSWFVNFYDGSNYAYLHIDPQAVLLVRDAPKPHAANPADAAARADALR